jgi:hypothetical protein
MRRGVAWLAWWIGLFWLWMLLVGEWNRIEWIAAACAATVAATVAEAARTAVGTRLRVPLRWVARSWSALPMVFVDFGILTAALVRSVAMRKVVRGRFRAREFPAGGDDPESAGVRAWVTIAATYSPNAYVVDIEAERGLVLLHDLVPFDRSESPA